MAKWEIIQGLGAGISAAMALAVLLGGCMADGEGGVQEDDVIVEGTEQELYYLASNFWSSHTINVCWSTDNNATEKLWVRQALTGQRAWGQNGNINLVGWGQCTASSTGIKIAAGGLMGTYGLGPQSGGSVAMVLDFGASPQNSYGRCTANSLTREECIKAVAIHEFGHALAIAHEHNRSDTPASCTASPQGTDGDTMFGAWDGVSIMNYCGLSPALSGTDRRGFERMYGSANADAPRMGDSNGDGRADLLCHDVTSGAKWADYASASGTFGATDWSTGGDWCSHASGKLFKGDFNGDGRQDLLCHDVVSGHKWVDLASASGTYAGTDWERAANWCNHNTAQLLVGDFNGDGRDDLLCHDVASGYKWVDYASASGTFLGTDWERAANWCGHKTGRVLAGDFNGDGRDDLLCHDVATGYKWVDYASASGTFLGTDWERNTNWCSHATAQLHVADFNGDGRDDFLCHDVSSGYKWVDYASASGTFLGTDWERNSSWCNHSNGRLFTGDFNGDGREDWLCHDVVSGSKWIDFADASGAFLGTDWSLATNWCSHSAGELH